MPGRTDAKLTERGIALPAAAAPAANYVPAVRAGNLVFVAGQLPMRDGKVACTGKLGADVSIEAGYAAARLCALNLLAQMRNLLDGDLDRILRCVNVKGFVNAEPDFADHPKVVNGASDLLVEVLGEAGRHSRSAVGVGSLPFGAAVEVEAVFEVA